MVKEVLQAIEGIEIYPVISLVIFFFSFLMVVLAVFRMKSKDVSYLEKLPLADSLREDVDPNENDLHNGKD